MVKILITLLAVGAVIFNWSSGAFDKRVAACTEPIHYTIGSFDRRFDISHQSFLSALAEAESVWEQPFRGEGLSDRGEGLSDRGEGLSDRGEGLSSTRDLFIYSPETGDLSINLIYDERQAVTEELTELEDEVEENEADYRVLEARYESLKTEHAGLKSVYDAKVSAFDQESALYEAHIETWNKGKRSSRQEFEALEAERLSLEAEIRELKTLEAALNREVQEINLLVNRLNRLARTLNLNVEVYNTVGASRGETFAGGIYYSNSEGEGIDIYEFENREKLVRILAHELGHALGLEHIADPQAIMYEFNEGEASQASINDLAALEALCASN